MKKRNAVLLADTRPGLVGHVLLQLKDTNPGIFDEAIIYYIEMSENDKKVMESILPCRFIKYSPPLPNELFEKERFRRFSVIMFARYEMFNYLDEFETVTWIDTDILIQKSIAGMLVEAKKSGFAILSEDPDNNSADNVDTMRTCFLHSYPDEYNLDEYLYCTGTIIVTDRLEIQADYAKWCYEKTIEWAEIMNLPDQAVINALIQEFKIPARPLDGSTYATFPSYGRDCSTSAYIHAWGDNKFWNDWYLYKKYPQWNHYFQQWLSMGGSNFLNEDICPMVSVVMPMYKPNFDWLAQSIGSLLNQKREVWQRYSNFEIVIVSEPGNQTEIEAFLAQYEDPRIAVYFNKERLGISASLNIGMRTAKGKYIARLDDDDIANEYRLFKQVTYLNLNSTVHMCVTNYHYFGDMKEYRNVFEGEMSRAWSIFTCPFDHPTIMFRKDFFFDNDLWYDEKRSHVEDWDLWRRAFIKGMVVGRVDEVLTYHRWRAGSAGQTQTNEEMMGNLVYTGFHELDVEIPPYLLPYVAPWKGRADQYLIQLEQLFELALKQNTKKNIYDEDALCKIFSFRLYEAEHGVLPYELAGKLPAEDTVGENLPVQNDSPGQQVPYGSFLIKGVKRILWPLYRPIQSRFEDHILNTEKTVTELQKNVHTVYDSIYGCKNELECLVRENQKELVKIKEKQLKTRLELYKYTNSLQDEFEDTRTSLCEIKSNINGLFAKVFEHTSKLNDKLNNRLNDISLDNGNELFAKMFEHTSTLNDQAINRVESVNGKVEELNKSLQFWNSYALSNVLIEKKIFLLGTPDHNNIGDSAIALGTYEFIGKYFSQYKVIEITGYQIDQKYEMLQATISETDLIMLQGGGNLGSMYLIEENIRRRIISDFPENRIIILPQTIYFEDTPEGKKELDISSEIYNRHRKLLLFTRGERSLSFARQHFSSAHISSTLDMALMLQRNYAFERQGILLCLRDLSDESGIDHASYTQIEETVMCFDNEYDKTENRHSAPVPERMRAAVVNSELKRYARREVVVTDRLHGLIFAIITHTPCVVMSAYTQKIREFVVFFDSTEAVQFIDKDVSKLAAAIEKAYKATDATFPVLEADPFGGIAKTIKSFLDVCN